MSESNVAWNLADLKSIPSRGVTVMSTFSCGGGSSMGYKLAGCDVIAANDIDPEMAWHYKHNLKPPLYYLCPIRDLLTADLPKELFELDILDGSPPCSTFSMAGSREDSWGKKKHFREGQASQVLSDLFFDFLDLVGRLRPRVVIAENVKGMLIGNAKGYTKMVMSRFKELGYRPQLFLINAADCGVPQQRERVFFCAIRDDIKAAPLELKPQHRWISAGEVTQDVQRLTSDELRGTRPCNTDLRFWHLTKEGQSFKHACKAQTGKGSFFSHRRIAKDKPAPTLTSNTFLFTHWSECRTLTFREWKRLGSFPDDYHAKSDKIGNYMIGMSVPPRMTAAVALAVIDQWIIPSRGLNHG